VSFCFADKRKARKKKKKEELMFFLFPIQDSKCGLELRPQMQSGSEMNRAKEETDTPSPFDLQMVVCGESYFFFFLSFFLSFFFSLHFFV
jgi:hypothetical protein